MKTIPANRLEEGARNRSVVTIGKFDGVHRGHQLLIDRVVEEARRLRAEAVIVEVESGSRRFPLSPFETKERLIAQRGVDLLVVVPWGSPWFEWDADCFIRSVLKRRLGMVKIISGPDFRFGRGRSGEVSLLSQRGMELGFEAEVLPFVHSGDRRISSTRIRSSIREGDRIEAVRMLGHEAVFPGLARTPA